MSSKKFFWLLVSFYITILSAYGQSVGGTTSGSQTYCDTLNSGFLSVTGYVGNIVTWQYSTNGGTTWTNNSNTFNTQSYFNLKQSTCYRAIVQNGSFPPDTSSIACITVYLPTVGGSISGANRFCVNSGSGVLTLSGHTGNVLNWQYSTNGGSSWTNLTNTTTTQPYSNITVNTMYQAVVQNSSFCSVDSSAIASFTIDAITNPGTISNTGSDSVCYDANTNTVNLSGNNGSVLSWLESLNNGVSWIPISNNTTTNVTYDITQTTIYASIVKNGVCPADTTNKIKIYVYSQNTVTAGNDTTIIQTQSLTLHGAGNGTPLWTPSFSLDNSSVFSPIASPATTTQYILTVTDVNSCMNSDTVLITVTPLSFEGIITTVFTPNGDGVNDNWYIEKINFYPENEVAVYNIYGQEVFTKKGYSNDWQGTHNGNPLPDGTYFYIVRIDSSSPTIKGSVDILRSK